MEKTFKREMALVLIIVLVSLSIFAMLSNDPAIIAARGAIVSTIAFPFLAFAAAAFGMDWVSKQTNWGGEPFHYSNDVILSNQSQGYPNDVQKPDPSTYE